MKLQGTLIDMPLAFELEGSSFWRRSAYDDFRSRHISCAVSQFSEFLQEFLYAKFYHQLPKPWSLG